MPEIEKNVENLPLEDNEGLSTFRQQWQQEIVSQTTGRGAPSSNATIAEVGNQLNNLELSQNDEEDDDVEDPEIKARSFFTAAVELEAAGKVFDAIPLYKKAVHLVPDIEYRLHEWNLKQSRQNEAKQKVNLKTFSGAESTQDGDIDLYTHFLDSVQENGRWCVPAVPQQTTNVHISHLPLEVLLIIGRWIVTNELDGRSLDNCAHVCKGFYLCARDPELWRAMCLKVWGLQLGGLRTDNNTLYLSWRQMFYERSRLRFDGCYISRTSYYRFGENSFQDQSYKPVHFIEYYRYLRFFADGGVVLMLTTPDEPGGTVKKLHVRQPKKKEVMRGFYRLTGDVVKIIVQRKVIQEVPVGGHVEKRAKRGVSVAPVETSYEQTFHIELRVQSSSRRRRFNQLHWLNYRIIRRKNGVETSSDFGLTKGEFPMFHFSRVEHYTQESVSMLGN